MTSLIEKKFQNLQPNIQNTTKNDNWGKAKDKAEQITKTAFVDLSRKNQKQLSELETFVNKTAYDVWLFYQKEYPEAFKNNPKLFKTTPKIVFIKTKEDLKGVYSYSGNHDMVNAYVRSNDPKTFYVYTPNNDLGWFKENKDYIKQTVAHELMHIVTNATVARTQSEGLRYNIFGEWKTSLETYPGAKRDLAQIVSIPSLVNFGQITKFPLSQMLIEGVADVLSTKITGSKGETPYYKPFVKFTKEIIKLVSLETYKKAMLENDPIAYKEIIKAALFLKKKYDMAYEKGVKSVPVLDIIDKGLKKIEPHL